MPLPFADALMILLPALISIPSKSGFSQPVAPAPRLRLLSPARAGLNRRSLGAGATGWLKPDFDGIEIRAGSRIISASAKGNGIELRFEKDAATFDHVLLGTGYRIDIARLGLFAPAMLAAIVRREGLPLLSAGFESSIPGLHFVGASAVGSFGPLMRFTAGTPFAARTVARFIQRARDGRYAAA